MQVSSQSAAALGPFCRPMKVAYPARAVDESMISGARLLCMRYLREHWTKIAVALIGGLLAGFLAGAVNSRESMAIGQVVYAAGVTPGQASAVTAAVVSASGMAKPSATEQAALEEVSRLRAENQQLQARVDELQNERAGRKHPHHRRRSGGRA
jgi:hypothetical protein